MRHQAPRGIEPFKRPRPAALAVQPRHHLKVRCWKQATALSTLRLRAIISRPLQQAGIRACMAYVHHAAIQSPTGQALVPTTLTSHELASQRAREG